MAIDTLTKNLKLANDQIRNYQAETERLNNQVSDKKYYS